MLKYKVAEPKYVHVVDIHDLPSDMQEFVHQTSVDNEYDVHDYRDGDYYFTVDFVGLPYSIQKEVDEHEVTDPDDPDDIAFSLYQWNELIATLKEQLPPEVVAQNKLAIYCWH